MISVDDVKKYLNIPGTNDDTLISGIITTGYDYLAGAIDDFSEKQKNEAFSRLADAWVLHMWCPDAYDQREGGFDGQRMAMNYPARAMLTQLQMYKEG